MTLLTIKDEQPSSILHELARNIKNATTSKQAAARYNEILQRITTNPRDTRYQCPIDGSTALHWIVVVHHNQNITSPPLAIVQAAIDAYPVSLTIKDSNGSSPCDLATFNGAKIVRKNKAQYDNMVSLLEERKKELVRGALDNLFVVRDNVESLESKFVQLKREHSTLSSQIDYVMETCSIFQKENIELKNMMKNIVQVNDQARKATADERKKLMTELNQENNTEIISGLVTDVGALREEVRDLQFNLDERDQQDEPTTLDSSISSSVDTSTRRKNNPKVAVSPEEFSCACLETTQMIKDISYQVKGIDARTCNLEEERDDADIQRRELFDKVDSVTNRQDTIEEIVENNERNLDNCQRQAKHELNMLQKEVEAAMAHKQGLKRTVEYLKAERLILLRGSNNEAETKRDNQGFHIAPLSTNGEKSYKGFEVEMLHDKVELLERLLEQTQTDMDGIKTQQELSVRHTGENGYSRTEISNTTQQQEIDDATQEKEQNCLHELENRNRAIQQEISYLRAERLVLMNYRHGSEIQRKRDWNALHTMQRSVDELQDSFVELKPRLKEKTSRKAKTDDKIDIPKSEIAAGTEETREAVAISSSVSSESRATRDLMAIYPTESSESLATQETRNSVRSTVPLPIAINQDKKVIIASLESPFAFGVDDAINSFIYSDASDHDNEYSQSRIATSQFTGEGEYDFSFNQQDDKEISRKMSMYKKNRERSTKLQMIKSKRTSQFTGEGKYNFSFNPQDDKEISKKMSMYKKNGKRSTKLQKMKSKRKEILQQHGEKAFPLLRHYLKRSYNSNRQQDEALLMSGDESTNSWEENEVLLMPGDKSQ